MEITALFVASTRGFVARGLCVMRAGLSARVSTHAQHTLPLQREATYHYVTSRGWRVVENIEDIGSGVAERPHREVLLQATRRRELDAIVVWRLDRWGRSLVDLSTTLEYTFSGICEVQEYAEPAIVAPRNPKQ